MRQAHAEGIVFSPALIAAMQSAYAAVCEATVLDTVAREIVASTITRLAKHGMQDPNELTDAGSRAAEACRAH